MKTGHIKHIRIEGFKSISRCDLEMRPLNVLIGPNGAGKSNFISYFHLLASIGKGELAYYTGSADVNSWLFGGLKVTDAIAGQVSTDLFRYEFTLRPTQNRLIIAREKLENFYPKSTTFGETDSEKSVFRTVYAGEVPSRIWMETLQDWKFFHFHDTSTTAYVKRAHLLSDYDYLRPDARNLASFLYFLKKKHPEHYDQIVKTVQLVAPFFGDFRLRPQLDNEDLIKLEWTHLHDDIPYQSSQLSDGTLRFICLATLLLQPSHLMPSTILIDEPELGLHPYAISVLGAMIRAAGVENQIIISTQSVSLLNEFEPEDIVVADRSGLGTSLRRVNSAELEEWLKEYTLGEIWEKNIIGGTPL